MFVLNSPPPLFRKPWVHMNSLEECVLTAFNFCFTLEDISWCVYKLVCLFFLCVYCHVSLTPFSLCIYVYVDIYVHTHVYIHIHTHLNRYLFLYYSVYIQKCLILFFLLFPTSHLLPPWSYGYSCGDFESISASSLLSSHKPYVLSPLHVAYFSNHMPNIIRLSVLGTRYFSIPLTLCAFVLGWS